MKKSFIFSVYKHILYSNEVDNILSASLKVQNAEIKRKENEF